MTEPTEPNYEDQDVADTWCAEMRLEVEQYLKSEEVVCGEISEWPAWHIAPYVSVWAIESAAQSGFVGAWVLCGDLPTDIIDGEGIEHPREAMAAIADRWLAYVKNARAGEPNDDMEIETSDDPEEMLELLESRAEVLREWAADDDMWVEDEDEDDDDDGEDAGDEGTDS